MQEPTTHPMPEPGADPAAPSPAPPDGADPSMGQKVFKRLVAHPFGKLGGLVVGALIGLAVQAGVASTGMLGPGVEAVLTQQAEGFAQLEAKLESLGKVETVEQAKAIAAELEVEVAKQRGTAQRLDEELRGIKAENERLKSDALATKGAAGGADLWLKPGESSAIGEAGNNFALLGFTYRGHTTDIGVNVNAAKQRMVVGDSVKFPVRNGEYSVIFKQGEARADGRVGFDVVLGPKPG